MRLFVVEYKGLDEEFIIVRAESEATLRKSYSTELYDVRELDVDGPAEELFRFARDFDYSDD